MSTRFACSILVSCALVIGCGKTNGITVARTAAAPTSNLSNEVNPAPTPAFEVAPPAFNTVYRYYSSSLRKHLFSLNSPEVAELPASSGWGFEGAAFQLYSQSYGSCSRALYRCYAGSANDHFVSGSPECEGYSNLGLLGYSCSAAVPGVMDVPLTRYYSRTTSDHIAVVVASEGESLARGGWIAELQVNLGFVSQIR